MVTGIRPLDAVVAEWAWGDYTPLSLLRAGCWWLLFLVAIACPGWRIRGRRWAERHPGWSLSLSFLWALGLGFLLFWPLASIEWGLTDDFEWSSLAEPDGSFPTSKMLERARTHWELGGALNTRGNLARFRPVYYVSKLLELRFWGDHPHGFGFDRILCLVIFLWGFQRTVQTFTDPLFGALVTTSLLVFPCGYDIWPRLGPSEAQAAVGFALFGMGFSQLWRHPRLATQPATWKTTLPWLVMAVGGIGAFGSKENFVILIVPAGLLAMRELWKKRPLGWAGYGSLVTMFLFWGIMAAILKFKLSLKQYQTIYGSSVRAEKLSVMVLHGCRNFFVSGWGVTLLAF
ncbi:MAG: hypothetical protein U0903_00590 [Planctomycetales bacterium]